MSLKRLREAAASAHRGREVVKFFSYTPYDAEGKPQPYRDALYAEVRGEMLAMGASAWYRPKEVPEVLRPIGEAEAQGMLDLMIRSETVRPYARLLPVEVPAYPKKRLS